MLMALDMKHLNPYQETSLLGRIIPNDLALNPMVNYRMNYLTTIVPYPWRVAVYIAKKIQFKNFYDNGGDYVHQSNDTVREFNSHLSDSKLQNAATTTAHLYTLLAGMFEKNI